MLIALLVPLILGTLFYCSVFAREAIRHGARPKGEAILLGAITNFFDTLGIGSFAPTMAWFKFRNMVEDRLIPPTMLCGHTPASMAQAIIFLILLGVAVDPVLLFGCVIAYLCGAMIGVSLVTRSRVWVVQLTVACGLLLAACFYTLSNLELMPVGGTANGLPPILTVIVIIANFAFGILVNFGVGNYAPTLAMLSLMGMDPRLSFPIMAGAAGLAGSAASTRYVLARRIDLRIATGIAIGGIPAVLIAAFLVKSMPIEWLRWMVCGIVLYAGIVMLRSALASRRKGVTDEIVPAIGE